MVLDPDQSVVLENAGRVVVQALNAARVRVTESRPPSAPRNRLTIPA
jgi:hypothetical protein